MKSLNLFPTSPKTFAVDEYYIDVRQQVGAQSPYDGEVGLELELEGHSLPVRYAGRNVGSSTWVHHADGSLRAVGGVNPGGAEYVLSQPCSRKEVKPLCDNLFAYIEQQGGRIQNSTRCSTHAHVNMRGAKLNQIASFVVLWGTFEDVIANWCGAHRSGNHFALRLSDCHSAVVNWCNAFAKGDFNFQRERRYLALNPACLSTFGSLEIRLGAGMTSSAEVEEYVNAILAVKDVAFSEEFANPVAIAGVFSGEGARSFANRVFGDEFVRELREACEALGEDFDRLILDGFRRVQQIVYVLPWADVISEIKKPFVPNPFGAPVRRNRAVRPLRLDEDEEMEIGDEG